MVRKIPVWSAAAFVAAAAVTIYALMTTRARSMAELTQEPTSTAVRIAPDSIRAGALWPQLRWYLKAFGDRLERPGKERLAVAGRLDSVGEQSVPVTAILEFPDKLQLTVHSGMQPRAVVYDGQNARGVGALLTGADLILIETLINDSAEHFFKAQAQGAPTRCLGERFRADDGSTENYTGPYHDVFSVEDKMIVGSSSRSQTKLYYFNSDTRLLERVTYQISENGETVDVETQFSDWKKVQDQQVAHRVIRLENSQPVLSLTITEATVSARLSDGLF